MVVVRLMGGLGNQMFQYACGRAIAHRLGRPLRLDHTMLELRRVPQGYTPRRYQLNEFGIDLRLGAPWSALLRASRRIARVWPAAVPWVFVDEMDTDAATTTFPDAPRLYITGYFQSEWYFKDIAPEIRRVFAFPDGDPPDDATARMIRDSEAAVGVLVRRGDYLSVAPGQVLESGYYRSAMNHLRGRLPSARFFVFTIGDSSWAAAEFGRMPDVRVIASDDDEFHGVGKMRLMAMCRHAIIANSSYAWWSAWLNDAPGKIVVAPRPRGIELQRGLTRRNDRYPAGWVLV